VFVHFCDGQLEEREREVACFRQFAEEGFLSAEGRRGRLGIFEPEEGFGERSVLAGGGALGRVGV